MLTTCFKKMVVPSRRLRYRFHTATHAQEDNRH
jgi:hypothetical protein